eukprot:6193624-Pleurochrysis_carterae.AAC.2
MHCRLTRKGRRMHKAPHHMLAIPHRAQDLPTLGFKVAACLYFLAHGAPTKVAADVGASIGVSTLRRWLQQFYNAVITDAKPEYMTGTPPDAKHWLMSARNSPLGVAFRNVAMASDGTHVPFHPYNKMYKKNKLVTTKADADVGYAGCSGDNTVLKLS